MKKSFISFLLNVSILLGTFFSLTTFAGCHSHEALGWDYDDTRHWQYCSCEKTLNSKKHTYDDEGWCTVCNYSDTPTEGVKYSFSSDGTYAQVVGYTGTSARVRISDTYNGSPIKSIAKEAFYNSFIHAVFIPSSVTHIGDGAFSGCNNLSNVNIPHKVTTIGNSAFSNCDSLQSITLPNSATSIGSFAFSGCSGLTSIAIPDSVTSIGERSFSGCSGLASITVNKNNKHYTSIDGNLYTKDEKILLQYANGKSKKAFTIPTGVTEIGRLAFVLCSNLTSITIPDSVTKIGTAAFSNCSGLTSITIPDGVTSIGNSAFKSCSGLTSINIPDGVTSIGYDAFYRCSRLNNITVNKNNEYYTSIDGNLYTKDEKTLIQYAVGKTATSFDVPDSVTSIGDAAFRGCSNLTSITIPDSVTKIGYNAFNGCSSLTSITIPDSVTEIESYAFHDCDNLTIYCKATERPTDWDRNWNPDDRPVVWGYTK